MGLRVLSIVIALLFGAGGFAAGRHFFGVGSGVLLGVLAFLIAVVVLARLVGKRFGAAQKEVEGHIRAQRVQKAIAGLEALRPLGRWHPLLAWSLDEQIGILRYAGLREIDEALPYLERARFKSGQAWAMLGAGLFRRGRQDDAERVFQQAMKRKPKERLVWAAYVWCALKRQRKDAALAALARARTSLPSDEGLHKMQLAIQNAKPVKMKPFGQDWYTLQLEPVPVLPGGPGISPSHPALRGIRRRR
jgi:tetratricopeptide (TPR) repeat protein